MEPVTKDLVYDNVFLGQSYHTSDAAVIEENGVVME
jgi:hypothetical protein